MSDITKTPREELECEKRYLYEYSMFWECKEHSKNQILEEDVCDLLNKFSREIEELNISISLFEDDVQIKDKKIVEQQATIRKLQDLCGESDSENAKLRIENKKLKAKLREKEEDEKLYANEIVELRKTNEEWLQFKDLGGDY